MAKTSSYTVSADYGYLYVPTSTYPSKRKISKSPDYVSSAKRTLKDYLYYRQITETEYKSLKQQINDAVSNDQVSNIMSRVRRKIYN